MNEVSRETTGSVRAPTQRKMGLPGNGQVRRYILTSAQNNTQLHEGLWGNLLVLAGHLKAELMVSRFTYSKRNPSAKGAKTASEKTTDTRDEFWDGNIEPYINDKNTELAPGLIFCGELQILPTAENPIVGLESYTGRASSILPHTKFAMQSIASPKHSGTKFIYTTGTVTVRNYIQKKAGQKASFHHGYGALLVEVDSDGNWFVRQLCADSDGTFYDLNMKVEAGKVTIGHRPEALNWGEIHERHLSYEMRELCFGEDGILDMLRPKRQVMHDLIDFRSQNHHDRDDHWKVFTKYVRQELSVRDELEDALSFLCTAIRSWCEILVVRSNHDEALLRWLKEADFREDPENAVFFLKANLSIYEGLGWRDDSAIDPFTVALEAVGSSKGHIITNGLNGITFLKRDESYVVCPDASGGVELGMHGDVGINGARKLSIRAFARTGRKCFIGHSHSAGWYEGARQVGVLGSLDQGYNQGMSSWSHTNGLVYPNGKSALFTIWNGKWRA